MKKETPCDDPRHERFRSVLGAFRECLACELQKKSDAYDLLECKILDLKERISALEADLSPFRPVV